MRLVEKVLVDPIHGQDDALLHSNVYLFHNKNSKNCDDQCKIPVNGFSDHVFKFNLFRTDH